MIVLRFFVALFLVTLGCAFIFQKDTILRLNAFMREKVFTDAHALLNGRRVGSVLIICGLMIFVISLSALR